MGGRLFGTNGIRGVFGAEGGLTLGTVHDVMLCAAPLFGGGPVLVGHDGRRSGAPVAAAARAALNFAGIGCDQAGLVPTPCLQHAVKRRGYAGGVMATASHNPPEYAGLKVVGHDGVEIARADEERIEAAYFAGGGRGAHRGAWGRTGPSPPDIIGLYVDGIASRVDRGAIAARGLSVVIDAGNGAQAAAAPRLCRALGCGSTAVNGNVEPDFPGRGPEPLPDNLGALSDEVRYSGADLGVAFDGDGDRSIFCDERGRVLTGDRSALLLSRFVLGRSPGSTAVTCLNSGSAIEGIAAASGAGVARTRVGSVEVSRRMIREGALVGFEENGGFMYGPHGASRDGGMALALALHMLASAPPGETLSGLAGSLPPSFTGKAKVPCPPGDAARVLAVLAAAHPGADATDGVRAELGGGRWAMVRQSGTEPVLRVYAEAGSRGELDAVLEEYAGAVRRLVAE